MGEDRKICRGCGVEKPLGEYYKHPQMADGHLHYCKVCRNEYMKNRPRDVLRAIDRRRNQKPARKEYMTRKARERRAANREQYKAHIAKNNALRAGKIVWQPCEVCGCAEFVHAHHDDYTKPLDVVWLCARHHAERHRLLSAERIPFEPDWRGGPDD